MEWLSWMKRVKPVGKRPIQKSEDPQNELVELIKKGKGTTWVKCEMDSTSLRKVLHIFTLLMAAGKTEAASDFCKELAENCFEQNPENPYRLLFLTFAMVADCETRFYDLNIFPLTRNDTSLKLRYSLCQEACVGILEMDPTIFKISELLTMCEELAHFSCFRQCHVNFLKNLYDLGPDENVDWFDIVKVLDSNILALINDSDIVFRYCDTEKEKKEFNQGIRRIQATIENNDQFTWSWFNHLHHREICVRSRAAMETLKVDMAYKSFALRNIFTPGRRLFMLDTNAKKIEKNNSQRKLEPHHPELEDMPKKNTLGVDSGIFSDDRMVVLKKHPKTLSKNKKFCPQKIYFTDLDPMNYCVSLFDDCKSFSDINADAVKAKSNERKAREKNFSAGGPSDCRKRIPDGVRRKIRMSLRNMMANGREIQTKRVNDDVMLNKAFPVSDDDCSDEETAPHPFLRTETLENIQRKKSRKFGKLNQKSDIKHVLWWQNARDELSTIRAIPNHCAKMNGESSEPFATFEAYMGKFENGGQLRDRMKESNREAKCRHFNITRETGTDDGYLLTMPPTDPFKNMVTREKKVPETVGLNTLLLQNMRRRCIDELLILLMIIKGHQQLQDGNVVRCLAFIMLIDYKFSVFAESSDCQPARENNFYPHLVRLRKQLFSKFRLYGTDIFGSTCTTLGEELFLSDDGGEDLNLKCYQFCRDTHAYFFCICIRGKIVELKTDELGRSVYALDKSAVEEQHEFFFGLETGMKSRHLSHFWMTECMPIISGLIHMVDHSLVETIDAMDPAEATEILMKIEGLSRQTQQWLKQVTKHGYLKFAENEKAKAVDEFVKKSVPMLFQLPSKVYADDKTTDMVREEDLDTIYEATTDFVRQKHASWEDACKADKANSSKTNRDQMFLVEKDLMFYGESIEKDVYMVAVYKGEKMPEEGNTISSKMHYLCRKLRSQAAFITAPSCHTEEGSTN